MKKIQNWEQKLNEACEDHDGVFGHNIEIDKSDFKKLAKYGADLDFEDYYTAKIYLPKNKKQRENILRYLIELRPTETRKSKKYKDLIICEWHY